MYDETQPVITTAPIMQSETGTYVGISSYGLSTYEEKDGFRIVAHNFMWSDLKISCEVGYMVEFQLVLTRHHHQRTY